MKKVHGHGLAGSTKPLISSKDISIGHRWAEMSTMSSQSVLFVTKLKANSFRVFIALPDYLKDIG